MDFAYPETDIEIRKLAGDILNDHATPERLKKLEADGPYLDRELWDKVVEAGLHGASLPEAVGGLGLDFSASTMVVEAIGQTVVSIPYIPCIISTALPLASVSGNATVDTLLGNIAAGETLATTAHMEPGNEDPLQPQTTAAVNGDSCTLDGIKLCVPYAAQSEAVLVSANAGGELVAALVETRGEGVELAELLATTGEPQYEITLNNATGAVVAQGDAARALLQKSVAMTLVAYSCMAVGVADKMMRLAGQYTSERKQFDTVIATFQAVAHRLADCYIDVECLKIITQKAVSDINSGNDNAESLAIAKIWVGDVLHRVSQSTQHVHGGFGIDRDYHLWRYCLWAKHLELALGSSKVHLEKLANQMEAELLANA